MPYFSVARYKLAKRGRVGLACDREGVALGPAHLVWPTRNDNGRLVFRAASPKWLVEVLKAAYGPGFDPEISYRTKKLAFIAQALTEGQLTQATIGTLHLQLPELTLDAAQRLASLAKYNPDQPRDWHGRWSNANGDHKPTPLDMLAGASRDICIDRCYHILERPKSHRASDLNYYAFLKCVADCEREHS